MVTNEMRITSSAVRLLAYEAIIHRSPALSRRINRRRFRANLGCSSRVCAYVWNRSVAKGILPPGFLPTHMLWTLVFLKLYCCETILATLCGCDEKTLRKWVWKGIDVLGELNLVCSTWQAVVHLTQRRRQQFLTLIAI